MGQASVKWIGREEIPKLSKENQIEISSEILMKLDSVISQLEKNWKINSEIKESFSSLSETKEDFQ